MSNWFYNVVLTRENKHSAIWYCSMTISTRQLWTTLKADLCFTVTKPSHLILSATMLLCLPTPPSIQSGQFDCTSPFLTCVGVMWVMSSDANCFNTVVLPALSNPRRRILTSWSGALFNLRRIDSKPCVSQKDRRYYLPSITFIIITHQGAAPPNR